MPATQAATFAADQLRDLIDITDRPDWIEVARAQAGTDDEAQAMAYLIGRFRHATGALLAEVDA